ncbi:MAG: hypothetical protein ACREEW_11215, partial [Caulobacteraceae bacterium]
MDEQTAREMMVVSILVCTVALPLLVYVLRRGGLSLGLPLAYLGQLLLIHVPGALAHVVGGVRLYGDGFVAIGIGITAVGVACFVVGVWA